MMRGWFLFMIVVVHAAWAKLCCDQDCTRPISYGRTKDRYITQEAGHLSFPNAAIVTVLIKQSSFDNSGQELWFAEIQGRKGLVPADFVTELHTLCEPKFIEKESEESHLHERKLGDSSYQDSYTSTDYLHMDSESHQASTGDEGEMEQEPVVEQQDTSTMQQGVFGEKTEEEGKPSNEAQDVHMHDSTDEFLTYDKGPLEEENGYINQHGQDYHEDSTSPSDTYMPSLGSVEAYDHSTDTIIELPEPTLVPSTETVFTTEPLFHQSPDEQPEEPDYMARSQSGFISSQIVDGNVPASEHEFLFNENEGETYWTAEDESGAREDFHESEPSSNQMPSSEEVPGDFSYSQYEQSFVPAPNSEMSTEDEGWPSYRDPVNLPHSQEDFSHVPLQQTEIQNEESVVDISETPTEGGNVLSTTIQDDVSEQDKSYDDDVYRLQTESEDAEASVDETLPGNDEGVESTTGGYPPSNGINVDEEYNVRVEDMSESEAHLPRPTATAVETSTVSQGHHYSYLDVQSLRQRYHKPADLQSESSTNVDELLPEHSTDNSYMDIHQTTTEPNKVEYTHTQSSAVPEETVLGTQHVSQTLPDVQQGAPSVDIGHSEHDNHESTAPPLNPEVTQDILHQELPDTEQENVLQDTPYDDQPPQVPLPSMEQVSRTIEENMATSHEQTDSTAHVSILDVIAQLSPKVAELFHDKVSEFGFVGVLASVLCLVIPLCCSCCHFWKDSRRKAKAISKHAASRKGLQDQIEKLKTEKRTVNTELLSVEEKCEQLQNEIEQMREENQSLSSNKVDMEEKYEQMCGELDSVQQELRSCTAQITQLRSEIKHQEMQLSTLSSEKDVALQQITLLQGQIMLSEQKVQELEAVKEQLEQDSFSTHNRYQELEELHKKVMQELTTTKSENSELSLKLENLQKEIDSLEQTRLDNAREIQTLQNCLNQLVATTPDGSSEQSDVASDVASDATHSPETLQKIQAMLDTTKVQTELQEVTKQRDNSVVALNEQMELVKSLKEENVHIRKHSCEVEAQLSQYKADFQRLQEKHKTLTEYFEQKEHNLHRMLGAEEAVRQAVETREAQVKEKAQSLEETEARHREELKQLRSEMFEIEKSLMSQVHTCQKRAEDAIAEQRRLEQECKALKLEREELRKRISTSPSGSKDHEQSNVLTVRPPSAPYLPRTSSPGVVDADESDHATSLLNQTDPLPSSHSQHPVISGHPRPPPFFVQHDPRGGGHYQPFQPPLQHPRPEHVRPRYPLPPPGRILSKGYPLYDRHPPRPRVYGPVPRYYRDMRERVPERRRPLSNPPPGARTTPPLVYDPHTSRNMHDSSAGFVPVQPPVPEDAYQTQNLAGEQIPVERPDEGKQ